MNRATILCAALLLTGCSSWFRPSRNAEPPEPAPPGPSAERPPADLRRDLLELRELLHELAQRVDRIEARMDAAVVAGIRTRRTDGAAGGGPADPRPRAGRAPAVGEPQAPAPEKSRTTPEDRLVKLIPEYRAADPDSDESSRLADEIAACGKAAVPVLVAGLADPEIRFRSKSEIALARMKPSDLLPGFLEYVRDPSLRLRAIRVLGNLGDPSAVPVLQEYLYDRNPDIRFATADALVKLKCRDGIPVLIETLKSNDPVKVSLALDTLRHGTGQELGARYPSSAGERRRTAQAWEEWWKENGEVFEFER